jgi:DNA-nicking Smr family endonuclease
MNEGPPRRRAHRRLSEAERMLWQEVTRCIVPLRPQAPVESGEVAPAPPLLKLSGLILGTGSAEPKPRTAPPLAPLGRRMRQRIARGSDAIGRRLDLHGLTQHDAHDALLGFLRAAQNRGDSIVLVITGKGAPNSEHGGRGVLRRQVPHWLKLPSFRDFVVGFEPAHAAHGGEGALYVWIRRKRDHA